MRMSPVQLLDRVRKLPNTPDLIEGYRFAVIMTWKIDTTEQDKELRDFSAKHSEITDYHKVLCVGTVKNRGLEAQEWQIYVGGLKNHESHMKWEGVPTNATLQFMGKVAKTDREITEIATKWVKRNPMYGPYSRCWTFVEDVWKAISES